MRKMPRKIADRTIGLQARIGQKITFEQIFGLLSDTGYCIIGLAISSCTKQFIVYLHFIDISLIRIYCGYRSRTIVVDLQELDGTRAYLETDTDEVSVVNAHLNDLPVKFSVCVNEGQDKLPTMYWLP